MQEELEMQKGNQLETNKKNPQILIYKVQKKIDAFQRKKGGVAVKRGEKERREALLNSFIV